MAATVSILTVDGGECASEGFVGIIRIADIRQTEPDKVKVSSCFRPGDIVRCKVVSIRNVPLQMQRRRGIDASDVKLDIAG